MFKWDAEKMKIMFDEKAAQENMSKCQWRKEFAQNIGVSESSLNKWIRKGNSGPKQNLLNEIWPMIKEECKDLNAFKDLEENGREEIETQYFEDTQKKLPGFCVEKLKEAYERVCEFLDRAAEGNRYTMLLDNDYVELRYLYAIYKPCAYNYQCSMLQDFFLGMKEQIRKEAEQNGVRISLEYGFYYPAEMEEGETPNRHNCLSISQYIENHREEHRNRIAYMKREFIEVWRVLVERAYPQDSCKATDVLEEVDEEVFL